MNLEQNTIFEEKKNHKIDCIAQSYYIETTKNNALMRCVKKITDK